jgi:hypothetical protein
LLLFFRLARVSAHGTEVAYCQLSDGTLRVFVAHWHGYGVSNGDTMTIDVGGTPLTRSSTGFVNNLNLANLPDCAATPTMASTCGYNYRDWGYWDFTGGGGAVCNGADASGLSVTLQQGNTVV